MRAENAIVPSSTRTLKAAVVSPTRRVLNHDDVSSHRVRKRRPAARAAASVSPAAARGGTLNTADAKPS